VQITADASCEKLKRPRAAGTGRAIKMAGNASIPHDKVCRKKEKMISVLLLGKHPEFGEKPPESSETRSNWTCF